MGGGLGQLRVKILVITGLVRNSGMGGRDASGEGRADLTLFPKESVDRWWLEEWFLSVAAPNTDKYKKRIQ